MKINRLGLDIGGVLKDISWGGDRDLFLSVPPKQKSFEVLRELYDSGYKDKIWIISKCKPFIESRLREWLYHYDFYAKTLINEKNVVFARDDEEKATYAKAAGVTHFIDDQIGILLRMSKFGVDNLYLFKPEETEHEARYKIYSQFIIVRSWDDIHKNLLNNSEL